MLEVFRTVNKILRVVFIGVVAITSLIKIFDIKPEKQVINTTDDDEYNTSEFDEIW